MSRVAARRLAAVPESAPRALELVRVSKERDGMVSPEVQRDAIGNYCRGRGYVITERLEGLDESGSDARSAWWARLEQAVGMVEQGLVDVIVVWKFSRIARHRLRWATALDRVERSGGRIESATEQMDTSTSTGRLTRGMLGELNAWQAELTGEVWREVHERRVRAGLPPTGKPKWGYAYDKAAKVHRPDPVTGPVLADLYRRYVAGESVYQLVRWLNGHGHRTLTGGPWSERTLRRVLDSGFAAGLFAFRGQLLEGVHQPLIDQTTWLAYQDARKLRAARPARVERSPYLLSGLVRCARCKGSMVAGNRGARVAGPVAYYRCKTGKERGPTECRGGYIMARMVEAAVMDKLGEWAAEVDASSSVAVAAAARRTSMQSEADRLAREVERAEDALTRLAVQNATTPLPPAVYEQAYGDLVGQLEILQDALEVAERDARRSIVDPAAAARGLLEGWATTPVEHRRELLRELVGVVWVWTGRPRAVVRVVESWEPHEDPPTISF